MVARLGPSEPAQSADVVARAQTIYRRDMTTPEYVEETRLVENIDESLQAIEEILGALLDISRLDAGAMTTSISSFKMADLMRSLEIEFAPSARAKGLELTFVSCSLPVESDRSLLRRL